MVAFPLDCLAKQQVNGKPAQCVATKAWERHCLFPKTEFAEPLFYDPRGAWPQWSDTLFSALAVQLHVDLPSERDVSLA
jgi:hypothetical protein